MSGEPETILWYGVDADQGKDNGGYKTLYRGNDAGEAMAAWSKAVSDGEVEYVMIEAFRERKRSD